jgi:hypothetical protein
MANTSKLHLLHAAKVYLRKEKKGKTTDSDDGSLNAKKRRIELEHQRQQVAIEEQRKLDDVRQRSKREQEDLTLQIKFHRQLEGLTSTFTPGLSSTILNFAQEEEKIPKGCWRKSPTDCGAILILRLGEECQIYLVPRLFITTLGKHSIIN